MKSQIAFLFLTNQLKIPTLELVALFFKRFYSMARHMHAINLLPGRDDSMLINFLNWALSIGRLLIILVETLALGTFLYRFTIDWQIVDLKDKVKAQRSIVASFKNQEETFRDFQVRLGLLKGLDALSSNSPNTLNDIIEMGRGYITFKSISVSSAAIRIEAKAHTAAPLLAFVSSLKQYRQVKAVSIDKVENKTSSAEIVVGISADLAQNDLSKNLKSEQAQILEPFAEQK